MKRLIPVLLVLWLLGGALSCAAAQETLNLIENGGFEHVDELGDPVDWYATSYRNEQGYSRLTVTQEKAHTGRYSAMIENASLNDARFVYTASVEPNSVYRLSCYALVDSMEGTGNGANLAVEDLYAFSFGLYDTQGQWEYLEWYGRTGSGQRQVTIGVRVGGYGAESIGKAWFDDVWLEKVDQAPQGTIPSIWYQIEAPRAATAQEAESEQKNTLWFALCAALFVLLACFARPLLHAGDGKGTVAAFCAVMALGLIVRGILAVRVAGYQVDIGCFTAWSLRMAELGPAGFYDPGNYFCDYPPGYMLLLWPCGLLLNALGAYTAQVGDVSLLVVKLMPILFDLAGATVLFCYARRRVGGVQAVLLAALYLFSPAVLVNGAAWGQADSVLALMLLLCVLTVMEEKWQYALPLYTLAVLLKPQALLFAPVAGAWLLFRLLRKTEKKKRRASLRDLAVGLLASALTALLVTLPFSVEQSDRFGWLVKLYGDTLSSYAYATLNTANLYYLLAANWKSIEAEVPRLLPLVTALACALPALWSYLREKKAGKAPSLRERNMRLSLLLCLFAAFQLGLAVFGATYAVFGYGMMGLVYAFVVLIVLDDPSPQRLPFYLALTLIGIYLLGVKVHERYLFVALPLLLLSYAVTKDRRMLGLFVGFSVTTFLNTAIVLDNSIRLGSSMGHLNDDTLVLNVALCLLNLLLAAYAGVVALLPAAADRSSQERADAKSADEKAAFQVPACYRQMLLTPADARLRLTRKDYAVMLAVTGLYAVLAFARLGSTVAPQNGWVSSAPEETVTFQLPESQPFYFMYYAGISYNSFSISVSEDGNAWSAVYPCNMNEGLCYRWNYALQSHTGTDGQPVYGDNSTMGKLLLHGKYLRINAESAGLNLFEITVRDEDGNTLPLTLTAHDNAHPEMLEEEKPAQNLIDEQDTCVGEPGWYNGMYFDEIYHARTAYEHLHGEKPYETTHPPLGKLIMAAGIAVFGMTPFGWRFSGALVGVLMLPALYLLAKQLFKRRDLAALSMTAFALDLMHYAQTRIATIDSFPVLFIILSYLCMARYLQTDTFAVGVGERVGLFTRAYKRSLIPLALSGLFMGLAIASKWIGLYSAAGLALLFFSGAYRQYRAGNFAFCYVGEQARKPESDPGKRIAVARDYALKRIPVTCGFCLLFFILVPCVIYYLSYIPYLSPTGPVTLQRVIQAQQGMLSYHSTPGLGMNHPFQSPWWQWPFILKPIWFAQDKFEPAGMASTIMGMGNPWVFYLGALCMAAAILALLCKHLTLDRQGLKLRRGNGDLTLYVLVAGFAAQYLPWVLVPRSMYIYHYFASVPFIILATVWAIGLIPEKQKKLRTAVMIAYLLGAAAFFVMFFPYASGWLTRVEWLDAMQWFSRLYY